MNMKWYSWKRSWIIFRNMNSRNRINWIDISANWNNILNRITNRSLISRSNIIRCRSCWGKGISILRSWSSSWMFLARSMIVCKRSMKSRMSRSASYQQRCSWMNRESCPMLSIRSRKASQAIISRIFTIIQSKRISKSSIEMSNSNNRAKIVNRMMSRISEEVKVKSRLA